MIVSEHAAIELLTSWLWPFFRIGAVVAVAPILGNRMVPVRIRLATAIALTVAVFPLVGSTPGLDPGSAAGALLITQEILVGIAFGFSIRLALVVMEIFGQLVAHLMGLGFASLVDPQNGIDVPVLSQFYILVASLVFLSIDGHLVMIAALAETFRTIPIGSLGLGQIEWWELAGNAGWVFALAFQLAAPAVVTLLIVNLAFGVISRAAPQLHIIVIGFPMTLVFGFVVLWLTYATIVAGVEPVLERAFEGAQRVLPGTD